MRECVNYRCPMVGTATRDATCSGCGQDTVAMGPSAARGMSRNPSEPVYVAPLPPDAGTREARAFAELAHVEREIQRLKRSRPMDVGGEAAMREQFRDLRREYREAYMRAFGEAPDAVPNPDEKAVPNGTRTWRGSRGRYSFTPNGDRYEENKSDLWSTVAKATFVIGLNVGDTPRYSMENVVAFVRRAMRGLGRQQDSSFVAQRGVYTHQAPEGQEPMVVEEDGVQVIVLNVDSKGNELPLEKFTEQMLQLGERLREQFEQETVIMVLEAPDQKTRTYGITQG